MKNTILAFVLFNIFSINIASHDSLAQLEFINKRICDLGALRRTDSLITKKIYFWNPSSDTLKINKVYKSCSCTDVNISELSISPCDTAYVEVKIDVKDKIGDQEMIIHLIANTAIHDHVIRMMFCIE